MNYDKVPELPDAPDKPVYQRAGVWLAVALVVVIGAAAWWKFGRGPAVPTAAQRARVEQVAGLDQRLADIRGELAALSADAAPAVSRTLLQEAIARQNEVMRLRAKPAAADVVRLSEWQARLDDIQARELGQQSRELETAAEALVRQRQPAAAVEKLREALKLQHEINGGLATRQLKSYGRESLLKRRIEELAAEPSGTTGAPDPRERIEDERQTLQARPLLEAVNTAETAATRHLRRRELFQAQQQLATAWEKLEEARQAAPLARGIDEALAERLHYLVRRTGDLGEIQDRTYDLLQHWPGRAATALTKTPVPQDLFTLVMNSNPSRATGHALPVDSLNHAEAVEFCRRLGWVLGAKVRLPTAEESRAAAKESPGGLGEWLETAEPDAAVAPVIAPDGSVSSVQRTERSRGTGLRVVVEVDLLAPR